MSGNLQSRLGKLELSTGINEPCEVCEAIERSKIRFEELIKRLGIVERKRTPALMKVECKWCLRLVELDLSFCNVSERVLWERMVSAFPAGTLCLPENKTLRDELNAAFERVAREKYGKHYDEYREIDNIYLDELAEISQRRVPRFHYVCRVKDCACSYPKDEAEYLSRTKSRGLAA